jgi:hypothetical protein
LVGYYQAVEWQVEGEPEMTVPAAIAHTAREGAESVFRYVERTAERVPDGIRWQTLSYENQPYYDASVFNGVGGIRLLAPDEVRMPLQ